MEELIYSDGDVNMKGKVFYPKTSEKCPAVLVGHDWSGCNEFAHSIAKDLANKGYIGIALDMYGEGKIGTTKEEKAALMTPLKEDRGLLRNRLLAAVEKLNSLEKYDGNNFAAIGFCFGGLCALDLARSGAKAKGVVSFHGLLGPTGLPQQKISSEVLVLHGYEDPMVPPEEILSFQQEMKECEAEFEFISYSKTVHAFTNPAANDPDFGTVYREKIAKKAWQRCYSFLEEAFTP